MFYRLFISVVCLSEWVEVEESRLDEVLYSLYLRVHNVPQ